MSAIRLIAFVAGLLSSQVGPAFAEQPPMTVATLMDRAQIEDLLVTYYSHLGTGGGDFGDFYVADGILDGLVHNAHRIEMRGDSMRKSRGKQS